MNVATRVNPVSVAEKDRRENMFRELDQPKLRGVQIFGLIVAVFVGLGLIGSGQAGSVFVGILIVGACVFFLIWRRRGELEEATPNELESTVEVKADEVREQALDRLKLDPHEDVLQSLTLVGGAPRPLIDGRIRSLTGPKKNPQKQWLPLFPSVEFERFFFGRYQIHSLFALRDAIAFYTRQYDFIDDDWVGSFTDNGVTVSQRQTNKIYYRNIENVRMTDRYMELQMVSGRSHYFMICVTDDDVLSDDRDKGPLNGEMAIKSQARDIDMVNAVMRDAGEAFEHAVNQLRDEWEQRQATR